MGAEVFTQSRADRDAELAAHDQLSREAVELRARLRNVEALADKWADKTTDLGFLGLPWAKELRAALAAEPAEVTPPAEQRAEGGE